tara:strand:+ start:6081 stop:6554 length:474 start_codon:yes stop_codon:yes gene_type:complete
MKSYKKLHCDNMAEISQDIYNFLQTHTDILTICHPGWHFIDCKKLLSEVPALSNYFHSIRLYPRHSAVTVVIDNYSLPIHTDEPPVIAKINMPVINTTGWANRWWHDDTIIDELVDQDQPIVFNSKIPHSVERIGPVTIPRIVASFTFFNEPLDLLK